MMIVRIDDHKKKQTVTIVRKLTCILSWWCEVDHDGDGEDYKNKLNKKLTCVLSSRCGEGHSSCTGETREPPEYFFYIFGIKTIFAERNILAEINIFVQS